MAEWALTSGRGRSRGRSAVVTALVAVVALTAAACSSSDDAGARAPRTSAGAPSSPDPSRAVRVIDADFPDPDVLRVGTTFHAYATQPKDGSANISMATSPDLRSWTLASQDPLPKLPSWATNGRTWAPDVSAVGSGFVMYFTARSVDPDLQCIGVARASDPAGPFQPVGDQPLVCPATEGGAIDPSSFVDVDGTRYLLWKNDGNCCGKDTWLHLQKMTADGLRTAGPARRLVRQDQPWEGQLVEAPTLVRHGSTYVLLYSANDYGGDKYATGYATASKITGPYVKADQPLLTTAGTGVTGPGGQDVVVDGDRTTIVFHGWDAAFVARGMYTAPLHWQDGKPALG